LITVKLCTIKSLKSKINGFRLDWFSYGNWTHTYMANDPVSVIAAFNPGDFWGAFKEFYNVYSTSNSAHSCYGSGSFGCSTIANPVRGGPVPTNQNSGLIRVYRGGELVSPQPIVSGGQP
jgi:hypothetical protein